MPIVSAILLVIGSVYIIQVLELDEDNSVYSYEGKLFNEDAVTTIEVTIDEEDFADILANPLDEEYKEAAVTINGETVERVAIRTKGNSSLTSVAQSDSERYSLKIDFNYYDSNQSFYGLTKLNLNNNMSDSTQMKEYVSYELMEQIGIETPAHSFMKVMINGEYYGLMLGVEAINETFVAQNYKTTEGYLYKPDGTGSDLIYISDSLDDYEGIEVKMNENSTEKSNLISMIKAINDGEGYEEYLNTDEMIRYFAMNTALVSLDSYQGQMKHNYYLYEDENGVFSILPWDYNMAFGGFGIGMGGGGLAPMSPNADTSDVSVNDKDATQNSAQTAENPQINEGKKQDNSQFLEREKVPMPQGGDRQNGGMMDSGELLSDDAINFSIYEPVSGTTLTDRPLLNVLLSDETILSQYEKYLEQISTEILTEENVTSITMKLGDLLTPYIEEDPSKFYTTEEFLGGVSGENSLSEFAKQRSESILAQLSGELVVESDEEDANGEPFQNGNVPQMNEEMQGGFDILSMTDEEFEQFLERIQSNNSPIALPDNFDSMRLEEKKAYVTKQMDNLQMPGGAGDRPMMNNEANGKEESTGEFTKEDIYTNLIYLAVLLIVIFAFRRIGK